MVNDKHLVCSCGYFDRHGLPCPHQSLILGPPKEEHVDVRWRTDYAFHFLRNGGDEALNAFFHEAIDNPPPGPFVTNSAVIAGPLCYPVLIRATDMGFFSDIVDLPKPVILNQCIPMGAIPTRSNMSNEVLESRVGWHLSQEVCLSQQQPDDEDDEHHEVEVTGSYSNAYATFTAHATKLSNLLQGCPHLVEKYSRIMAQSYAAAVAEVEEEPDVNLPRPSSSSNGTISFNLETRRSQKKPKRLGS
jgi:hypothetical protein